MILRIATLLLSALISVTTCMAAIEVPVSVDGSDYPDKDYNRGHRSRPIVHWCTIDIENGSVDSSVTDIVSYELVDADNNVTVAESDPSAFVAHLGLLSSGSYTLRLRTADNTTYSGIIDL